MIKVVTIHALSLGDPAYLATDGASAPMINPRRRIGRTLPVVAPGGSR